MTPHPQSWSNSQAHTYSKDGDLSGKVLQGGDADTRIGFRMAWAGTDDELCRVRGDELFESDLVVPVDGNGGTLESEELVNVPGEGIVVVNHDDIGS